VVLLALQVHEGFLARLELDMKEGRMRMYSKSSTPMWSLVSEEGGEPIRVGEAITVLAREEQLVPLELLERLDQGVGGGNLEVEGKKERRALSTSCWPS